MTAHVAALLTLLALPGDLLGPSELPPAHDAIIEAGARLPFVAFASADEEALSRAVQNAVSTSREAEAASARGLMGEGSVTDLVVAVGRAELTLQTAVAVRDRVVAAYQEVMRMPI
jgi:flagellar hook-basal body complex protein FliE